MTFRPYGRQRSEAGKDPARRRIVSRGVVRAGAPEADERGERRDCPARTTRSATDVAWLATQGVTEVFYDLNWDPLIGSPDVDPAAAAERAEEIMRALAPSTSRDA